MANKKLRAERESKLKSEIYLDSLKKTGKYHRIALALIPALFLCYFFNWVYLYNTRIGMGTQAKVSGWSFIIAAITRTYTSTDAVYGDIAVPFFSYAKNYCEQLGTFTFISLIIAVLTAVCEGIIVFGKKYKLSYVSCALQLLQVVCLFICSNIAKSMNGSAIISDFCSANPECSVKSAIFVSILVSLTGAFCSVVSLIKTIIAGKDS